MTLYAIFILGFFLPGSYSCLSFLSHTSCRSGGLILCTPLDAAITFPGSRLDQSRSFFHCFLLFSQLPFLLLPPTSCSSTSFSSSASCYSAVCSSASCTCVSSSSLADSIFLVPPSTSYALIFFAVTPLPAPVSTHHCSFRSFFPLTTSCFLLSAAPLLPVVPLLPAHDFMMI